ncbi:histidinol-phosphatase [Treponema sp.]|uniref:histidinol-phosphatase n=1 Tax=Treponema sp. TaxID=166 RepID=UPI0025F0DD94|nr:histidinol-phosphatase [Treponema sp.]MCR5219065.1 histidinol-phosphatase [Treponema sp.]
MNQSFIYSNYHVHSDFCDGHNSLKEMAEAALKENIKSLGFSSHALQSFATEWHLKPERYDEYAEEIRKLKKEYADRMDIYLGFEADYLKGYVLPDMANFSRWSPDYLIGAVHFVPAERGCFEADASVKDFPDDIQKAGCKDTKEAVSLYFETEREMLKKCSFTILAHPDLIRKQNSKEMRFDQKESWYIEEVKSTVREIKKAGVCVEINTGGIARGYLEEPYPSPYFLELLHQENIPVMINTDAHRTEHIAFWYDKARQYALNAGYSELALIKEGRLTFQKI